MLIKSREETSTSDQNEPVRLRSQILAGSRLQRDAEEQSAAEELLAKIIRWVVWNKE